MKFLFLFKFVCWLTMFLLWQMCCTMSVWRWRESNHNLQKHKNRTITLNVSFHCKPWWQQALRYITAKYYSKVKTERWTELFKMHCIINISFVLKPCLLPILVSVNNPLWFHTISAKSSLEIVKDTTVLTVAFTHELLT